MGWVLLGMLKEPWLVGLLSLEKATCAAMGKGCGRAGGSCCAGDGTWAPTSGSQAACELLLGGSSHQAVAPMAHSNTSKPNRRKGRGRGRQGAVQQRALVSLPAGTHD